MKANKIIKTITITTLQNGSTKWSILTTDGQWASTFDVEVGHYIENNLKDGDRIELEIVMSRNNKFQNIVTIEKYVDVRDDQPVLPPPAQAPTSAPAPQNLTTDNLLAIRLNALKEAVKFEVECDKETAGIVNTLIVAKKFENYILTGEIEGG